MQGDDCFFPVRQPAHSNLVTPFLSQAVLRSHFGDPDAEQFFHRHSNLILGRPLIHLKRVGIVVSELVRSLFGDQRLQDHLVRLQVRSSGCLVPYRHHSSYFLPFTLSSSSILPTPPSSAATVSAEAPNRR